MAYDDTVKRAVRRDYIKGLHLKESAEQSGVPYETARSWKRKAEADGDDWDTARAANRISSGGVHDLTNAVIEDFVLLFKTTIDAIKEAGNIKPLQKAEALARLSDAYTKTIKAAGDSNPKLSKLAVAMDVLQRQAMFIREHFPQHQAAFLQLLEPFGEAISREYR